MSHVNIILEIVAAHNDNINIHLMVLIEYLILMLHIHQYIGKLL